MTDELDDLKAAMTAATPAPDAAAKRENITLAQKNFASLQGSRIEPRQTIQTGPLGRILNGARTMLHSLTTRPALAASTALVAVGLIAILPNSGEFTNGFTPEPLLESPAQDDEVDAEIVGADAVVATTAPQVSNSAPLVEPTAVPESSGTAGVTISGSAETGIADRNFSESSDDIRRSPESGSARLDDLEIGSIVASKPSPQIATKSTPRARRLNSDIDVIYSESETDAFANAPTSPLKITTEDPVSTFSIDVDTAAYSVVRRWIMNGTLPPAEAVRIEEIINYFPYAYPTPEGPHPFEPTISVVPTPWNEGTNLVHIGIQGSMPAVEDRAPLNLVFLIDTSGSMQSADKLPLLKQSFRLMINQLRPDDEISIVTYAGSAGQVLEPTRAAERNAILSALDKLEAGGSTAGQAGLQQAYQVAESMADDGEVTRVILATDGDFNVGLSDPDALKTFIADKRDSGTYLSVLGFGRGNLDDATMQALAQNGNGQAAYIDTLSEAQKVLVDQLTGALFPIANDVKIQVEFNPAQIAEYRLIGYETRALNREDFANDRVDAGDIGAGHRVTAIYEVTAVGSDAIRNGPLRYSEASETATPTASNELGYFKLRYKRPGETQSILIETPIQPVQSTPGTDVRFSIAMAGFGELLRGGDALGAWDWADAIDFASGAKGQDVYGYRAEAITLMRLAESLDQ